jgi:hypothetical protein
MVVTTVLDFHGKKSIFSQSVTTFSREFHADLAHDDVTAGITGRPMATTADGGMMEPAGSSTWR